MFEKQLITTTIGAVSLGLAATAQAEVDVEFSVGYDSEYNYRGFQLGDQSPWYGLDASGSCDCGVNWNAGVWGINPDNGANEFDYYLGVSKEFGAGEVSFGYTAYTYDDNTPNDSELYLGYSGEVAGLSYGLTYFYGLEGALDDADFIQGDLSYGYDLSETLSAEIAVQAGYFFDTATDYDGLGWYTISLGLSAALSDSITLGGHISYTEGDDDVDYIGTSTASDSIYGGVSLSFAF